jgi:hypothetical protein
MRMSLRAFRALTTATLLGAALLTDGTEDLTAPTLTSATIKGDNVRLLWRPPGGANNHAIYANGSFVQRTLSPDSVTIFLASHGLSGNESFTVVAEERSDQSPPSNAQRPRPAATLPTPQLTSAVRGTGSVTLTWTPSRTTEMSGEIAYTIFADDFRAASVLNTTTAKVPLEQGPFVLTGREVFTVIAHDRTLAESLPSNGLVPAGDADWN